MFHEETCKGGAERTAVDGQARITNDGGDLGNSRLRPDFNDPYQYVK